MLKILIFISNVRQLPDLPTLRYGRKLLMWIMVPISNFPWPILLYKQGRIITSTCILYCLGFAGNGRFVVYSVFLISLLYQIYNFSNSRGNWTDSPTDPCMCWTNSLRLDLLVTTSSHSFKSFYILFNVSNRANICHFLCYVIAKFRGK